jgi:hypothetical protein
MSVFIHGPVYKVVQRIKNTCSILLLYVFFLFYVSTIKLQIKKITQIKVFFFKTKEKDRKKHKVYFYKKEKVKNCAASVFPVPCSYNKEP